MDLSQAEIEEFVKIERELKKRDCLNSFQAFVKAAWHIVEPNNPYIHGRHIEAKCLHLEACYDGRIRNLVINEPPRHAKSSIVAVMFPAWVWLKDPHLSFMFASYSGNLSKRDSIKCRRLIESDWYQETFQPAWKLASDQNEKSLFLNTLGGERLATSVSGSALGRGADFAIGDDLTKATEIYSEPAREEIEDFWNETVSTRGNNPKTFVRIIIAQRLHELDICGTTLATGLYEHLKLPAEYEGEKNRTSIGWEDWRDEPGELLWPERFGKKEIEDLKKALGSTAAAGQLQQRPAPAEGNLFKRSWFQFYKVLPTIHQYVMAWDLTFKDKATGDYVVGQVWGANRADKYLIYELRARLDFPAQIQAIRATSAKFPYVTAKLIEDAANGAAVIATLKKEIMGIIPVRADRDKVSRANAVLPQFEAGNVHLPDPSIAPWISDYMDELSSFPNAAHDDRVDSSIYALSYLSRSAEIAMPVAGHSGAGRRF